MRALRITSKEDMKNRAANRQLCSISSRILSQTFRGDNTVTATQFGTAYTEGFDHTIRFLASKGLPEAEARETAQAAWARGFERRHQLRDPKMVLTWINSIAFNLFRNEFRRNARHSELPDVPDRRPQLSISRLDAKSVLSQCDHLDRSLLWMQYGEGFTSVEIAGRMGMNAGTVRIRIMRAKGRLRSRKAAAVAANLQRAA
jgi:RNA polymerase sigma factor (sigma-70 family)